MFGIVGMLLFFFVSHICWVVWFVFVSDFVFLTVFDVL